MTPATTLSSTPSIPWKQQKQIIILITVIITIKTIMISIIIIIIQVMEIIDPRMREWQRCMILMIQRLLSFPLLILS